MVLSQEIDHQVVKVDQLVLVVNALLLKTLIE